MGAPVFSLWPFRVHPTNVLVHEFLGPKALAASGAREDYRLYFRIFVLIWFGTLTLVVFHGLLLQWLGRKRRSCTWGHTIPLLVSHGFLHWPLRWSRRSWTWCHITTTVLFHGLGVQQLGLSRGSFTSSRRFTGNLNQHGGRPWFSRCKSPHGAFDVVLVRVRERWRRDPAIDLNQDMLAQFD